MGSNVEVVKGFKRNLIMSSFEPISTVVADADAVAANAALFDASTDVVLDAVITAVDAVIVCFN